jgi:hypothetical protein
MKELYLKAGYVILVFGFLFLGRYVFHSLKSGVFRNHYGDSLTVRKSEGVLGFYLMAVLYIGLFLFFGYLILTRFRAVWFS